MTLRMRPEHEAAIREHGRETYPGECCGFLVGRWDDDGGKTVIAVHRAENARKDSPANRYLIPPEQFVRNQREATARGLDIVGFYHSHPDVPARPSEYDRTHAWPMYSYVIVSVQGGEPCEVQAWTLAEEGQAFAAEPLATAASLDPRMASEPLAGGSGSEDGAWQ